jgi:voltage-gated potassium channel
MQAGKRAVLRVGLGALAVVAAGTAGYMVLDGAGLLDALYMTVITVTTIGYGEVFPLSSAGRIFTMVLAFAGVGIMLLLASEFARIVIEGDIQRLMGLRKDIRMVGRMDRHMIVCGYGRMGRAVVEILKQRGSRFVVVEQDTEKCQSLQEESIPFVQGDASQHQVMETAGVGRATTVIVCLPDDAHGVFTVLLARQLNPDVTIIARAVEEQSEERLRMAGADRVINPYRIGGMRLAFTALKPTVVDFLDSSLPGTKGELELAEIRIRPGSELDGKTIAGAAVRRRFGIIVIALKREDGSLFNPDPDTEMRAGDLLVALGTAEAIESIERASG